MAKGNNAHKKEVKKPKKKVQNLPKKALTKRRNKLGLFKVAVCRGNAPLHLQ